MTAPAIYRVSFQDNRIGRHHDVEPLTAGANDADDLAKQIYDYARPRLGSRDVEVAVDLEQMNGVILCGFRPGARFTIEQQELRICIDANCPACDWPERWFSPERQLFGCPKCDFTSIEREGTAQPSTSGGDS